MITEWREQTAEENFIGCSDWAGLCRQPEEPLFDPDEALTLSPSRIEDYVACPQKFYYRRLLSLQGDGSLATQLGTLIHRLMEVFHRQFSIEMQTAETLRHLAERMFELAEAEGSQAEGSQNNEWEEDGFQKRDLILLKTLDPLKFHELKCRLNLALQDLEDKGYFDTPVCRVLPEYQIQDGVLPGLDRCRFSGAIDALREYTDGTWEIVDYKSYGPNRFKTPDMSRLQNRLRHVFTPLPESAVSHAERFAVTDAKPRYYQLPLYYLLLSRQEPFAGKIREAALQIIRPALGETNGSVRIPLSAEEIESGADQLVSDLDRYVVDPILSARRFETNPNQECIRCEFISICPAAAEKEDEMADEDSTLQ